MLKNSLKIALLLFIGTLTCLGFTLGCKNAADPLGHQGPFDVPTATITPYQVNVNCFVNYNGSQVGVNWNLVDPNGNTINSVVQSTGGSPLVFNATTYGIYSVNIPTQGPYLYSSQPLTITKTGNYAVTFSCSGQTLSTSPTSLTYTSAVGYQIPVTLSYSSVGNLNVPVSISTSGLPSAFSINPSNLVLGNGTNSSILAVSKNSAYILNTSLACSVTDFGGTSVSSILNIPISRSYQIPVTFYYSVGSMSEVNNSGVYNVQATYTFTVNDGGLTSSSSSYYSYATAFTPTNILTNPVAYTGTFTYSNPADFVAVNQTYITLWSNNTDVTFTLPDGTTRSCSSCVNFNYPTSVGQTELFTASY